MNGITITVLYFCDDHGKKHTQAAPNNNIYNNNNKDNFKNNNKR